MQLKNNNMKTLIKTCVFILLTNYTFAQLPILTYTSHANYLHNKSHGTSGNYGVDTNNERDQYVGLWEYNMNGTLFQLKIEKVDQFLVNLNFNNQNPNSYYYNDVVIFKYKLIKNGVTLYDNLNTPILNNFSQGTKLASNSYLGGRFIEYYRGVNTLCEITKLSAIPEKINFNISRHIYSLLNPASFYQDGLPLFFIPANGIIMNKI